MKPITVEMILGEGLQWFCSTTADLPGWVCNGGNVCNITPALMFTSEEYFILLLSLDLKFIEEFHKLYRRTRILLRD